MLLFSSSSFLSSCGCSSLSTATTTSRQRCSIVLLGVPVVLAIILVNFISSTAGAIDTTQQLNYYQTLARHLHDFTVKDDAEDLLALPSDSKGASVAVVAPPPDMARSGPITSYAKASEATNEQQKEQEQKQPQKQKKARGNRHQRRHNAPETEDNVAQESNQGGATVAFAAAPESFTASSKGYFRSSSSGDSVAQESYQSAAYAPAPETPAASSKTTYDRAASDDTVAQESYQSVAYAPPPASPTASSKLLYHRTPDAKDSVAQESYQSPAYAPAPASPTASSKLLYHRDTDSKDSVAQESYQSRAYASPPAPAPASSTSSTSDSAKYDEYLRSSAAADSQAQESYQSKSYAPAPAQSVPSSSDYQQYHRNSDTSSSSTSSTRDNVAQESYQSRQYYAPVPPPPASLSPSSAPPAPAAKKSYYEYYPSSSTVANDNRAQESYQTQRSHAPPPGPSSQLSASPAAGTNVPAANDNQAQESYQAARLYAPPAPPSSPNYYPSPHYSTDNSNYQNSYYPQSDGALPPPPPVTSYNPPYSPSYRSPQPPPSYGSPQPVPAYGSPQPVPAYDSPQPAPTYGSPQPAPSYVSPQVVPSYGPPQPVPSYGSPQAAPSYESPQVAPTYGSPQAAPTYGSPQAAPSSHVHQYYSPPPAPQSPDHPPQPSYPAEPAAPAYAPFPATTPVPAARAQYNRELSYYPPQQPTILQPAASRTAHNNDASASASSPLLAHHPHLTSIDKHQQEQRNQQQQTSYSSPTSSNSPYSGYTRETFEFSPAPPGPPPFVNPPPSPPPATLGSPSTTPSDQSLAEDSLQKQQKLLSNAIGTGLDIYKTAVNVPTKLALKAVNFLASLSIPKEHYLNVISFVGVYLFMSIMFYGQDDLIQQKCEGGEEHLHKEWHYHVGRRFVPAVKKVDKKMQKKFLKLFKGLHLQDEDDGDGSSSEEDQSLVSHVNDMCPRGAFFYSLAPNHLEARMQVQRILVAQPSPAHVYAAAKALLYKHKIHPKIWYLGLIAAALERPDMTGFKLAHPLDAIPDWFIPGHLIQDEMDRYRAINLERSAHKRVARAAPANITSTKIILTTTPRPTTSTTTLSPSSTTKSSKVITTTARSNATFSSTTTKFTRKPLLFTRRSTTTYRPPDFSYFSGDSGSIENIVLDGTPPHLKGGDDIVDYLPFDEEAINESVQKYQELNTSPGKYKPKKKEKKPKPSKEQEQDSAEQDVELVETPIDTDTDKSNDNDIDTSSTETEADHAYSSEDASSASAAQQNDATETKEIISHNDLTVADGDAAVIAPAPPSVRPSHLTSGNHNAIKVGDLTVVVGSGPSLLNDVPVYSLQDHKEKLQEYQYERNHKKHKKGDHHHKKGKGKGKDCIIVDGKVGRDNGIENRLWYFREDMMVNQFHWYWHLTHPVNSTNHPDRRAELFFFTHRQFLARYNAERMSNGLNRMIHMKHLGPGGIIVEPYHSHLADVASGKYWTPRYPKRIMRDILHEHNPDIGRNILLKDVATIYDRLIKSVTTGLMLSSRKGIINIRNTKGIEPLANTVEATELSVNPAIYDTFGLHNTGHLVLGLVEDPDWKFKKAPGVMSEVATSMRDPIFYNYHAYIDNILEKHKETLSPYKVNGGEFPLLWKGVKVLDVEMVSKGNGPLNQLRTFWTKKKFELAPSVDASTDNEHATMCAVHLAHEPFTFKITIEKRTCTPNKSGKGSIRIFIAPRFDEKGRRIHLREQRRLMIQLDTFQAKLRVGRNIITRRSHDSSLTQPWTKHLADFKEKDKSGAADFCGCGWPQHLFIPKGTRKGMPFDLFVMVTNYDEDHVPNHPKDLEVPETCNSPYLFCGHPRRKYPDARPMGYPWDRPPYKTPLPCLPGHSFSAVICKSFNLVAFKPIDTLEEFVAKAPNMKSIVFDIRHIDKLVKGYHRHH